MHHVRLRSSCCVCARELAPRCRSWAGFASPCSLGSRKPPDVCRRAVSAPSLLCHCLAWSSHPAPCSIHPSHVASSAACKPPKWCWRAISTPSLMYPCLVIMEQSHCPVFNPPKPRGAQRRLMELSTTDLLTSQECSPCGRKSFYTSCFQDARGPFGCRVFLMRLCRDTAKRESLRVCGRRKKESTLLRSAICHAA